jgi:hypothetical protein
MVVHVVTNLRVFYEASCSLTSWETISFPRSALSMKLVCVASSQGNGELQQQLQHVETLILTPRDITWQWLLLHRRRNGTAFHHVQESQWFQIGPDPEITARSNTLCYDFYFTRSRCVVWLQTVQKSLGVSGQWEATCWNIIETKNSGHNFTYKLVLQDRSFSWMS